MWSSRSGGARAFRVAAAILALAALSGCRKEWRTDMWYQPAQRAEENPRPEPEGSVPLGAGMPLTSHDQTDSLRNPVPIDSLSVRHGRFLFANRCLPCHGDEGLGGGPVSKFFPPAPSLAYKTIVARSDGYIFGTITFGGRAMPSQIEGLTERDRWDLVNAVRVIQQRHPEAREAGGSDAGGSAGDSGSGEATTP